MQGKMNEAQSCFRQPALLTTRTQEVRMAHTILPIDGVSVIIETGVVIGRRGRPLKPMLNSAGYHRVYVRTKVRWLVHRLVWCAAHGAIPDGIHINHINGVKTDNRIENLELATASQNIRHAHSLSLYPLGENHGMAKLSNDQVRECKALHRAGWTHRALAARYGVSRVTIGDMLRGRTWQHIKEV